MEATPFFLVWCPTRSAPTVQQPSFEIAEAEAKRLARLSPGDEFFVTAAVARVIKIDVGVTRFALPEPVWKPNERPKCGQCNLPITPPGQRMKPDECDCIPF